MGISSQRQKVSQDNIELDLTCMLLCVFFSSSLVREKRGYLCFPGTSCLVPIYVQNRELVKFPMTTIDNDDIALMMHADIALIGLSVE